jgi:hypothetical protein
MTEKNEIIVTKKHLAVTNTHSLLSPYKKEEQLIIRDNCKLCNSEFRKEAERIFAQTGKAIAAYNFLIEKHVDISQPSVRNHMTRHYQQIIQQQAILESSEDLQRWVDMEQTKVGSIKKTMAWIDKERAVLQILSEEMNPEERRKTVDTIKKLSDTWLVFQTKLDEYQKTAEPITIIVNQLKIVLTEEMSKSKNEDAKQAITNVMQKMQNSMEELGLVIDNGEIKHGGD